MIACISLVAGCVVACFASQELNSGWQLAKASDVGSDGALISGASFAPDTSWIAATVPGTVFASYVAQGLRKDPLYGTNLDSTSDEDQNRRFWYRTVLTAPAFSAKDKIILHVDGINWKARIWINGNFAGSQSYAFKRGSYDITPFITSNTLLCIAIGIDSCAHPNTRYTKRYIKGTDFTRNGGELGRDCPTFTASQNWNWLPTVPGRNPAFTLCSRDRAGVCL